VILRVPVELSRVVRVRRPARRGTFTENFFSSAPTRSCLRRSDAHPGRAERESVPTLRSHNGRSASTSLDRRRSRCTLPRALYRSHLSRALIDRFNKALARSAVALAAASPALDQKREQLGMLRPAAGTRRSIERSRGRRERSCSSRRWSSDRSSL
jgi:hypothetical protein